MSRRAGGTAAFAGGLRALGPMPRGAACSVPMRGAAPQTPRDISGQKKTCRGHVPALARAFHAACHSRGLPPPASAPRPHSQSVVSAASGHTFVACGARCLDFESELEAALRTLRPPPLGGAEGFLGDLGGTEGSGGRRVSEGEPKGTEWRGGGPKGPRTRRGSGVGRGKVRETGRRPKEVGGSSNVRRMQNYQKLKKEAKLPKTLF